MSDTRERLLVAARHCLEEGGLAATTSRRIAAEAEANLGAISYYFGSKDALVAEALIGALDEWLAPAVVVLAGPGEPTERMVATIRTLTTTFEAHRHESQLLLEAIVQAPRIESLHGPLVSRWRELQGLLASQLGDLRGQGVVPRWVEPETMACLLMAVAGGLVVQTTIDPGGASLPAMAGQFANLLLEAH